MIDLLKKQTKKQTETFQVISILFNQHKFSTALAMLYQMWLAPYIPHTKEFTQKVEGYFYAFVRKQVKLFDGLQSIKQEQMKDLRPKIFLHERNLAYFDCRVKILNEVINLISKIIVLGLGLLLPVLVAVRLSLLHAFIFYLLYISFGELMLLSLLVYLISRVMYLLTKFTYPVLSLIAQLCLLGTIPFFSTRIILEILGFPLPDFLNWLLITPFIIISIRSLVGIVVVLMLFVVTAPFQLEQFWRYPESIAVNELISILATLENNTAWGTLKQKKQINASLDRIVKATERALPQQMFFQDEITKLWLKQRFLEIATMFRNYKKWIILPKSDTKEHLIEKMQHSLFCFATGSLDYLDKDKPEQNQRFVYLFGIMKVLFLAILPFLILFCIQQSPLSIPGNKLEYPLLLALGLSVSTIYGAVDPKMSEKISTVKSLAEIFSKKL